VQLQQLSLPLIYQTLLPKEYFGKGILDELQQYIEELHIPSYYPTVVKEAINLALGKGTNFVDTLFRLLEHVCREIF
jgi:translation initiation factor 4G